MASNQEQKLPLTLLVDKEKNRVVVAEANGDLIDTLFSFLTLPLGTIIRLVFNDQQPQEEKIGCIKNLYKSVENFSDAVFMNSICKAMLLYPRNPCESLCQMLKLNVNDSEEVKLHGDLNDMDCVFVKKENLYLIFDDLKVTQSSPGSTLQQLQQLGYRNFNKLAHMSATVGLKEILNLLKKALTSTSPLSDVLLANGEFNRMYPSFVRFRRFNFSDTTMNLKVTVSKSKKKILYAEAEGDFVDFLFSFLTTPIGSVREQLDGIFSFGCMNNLHESVEELNPSCFVRPLEDMNLFEPRYLFGEMESAVGFVKKPSQFVVWDNLQVTPLENTASSIAFLQKLNVPLDDLEEHLVCITETEARNLLGASLTYSEAVLTEALFCLVKKPKEEAN